MVLRCPLSRPSFFISSLGPRNSFDLEIKNARLILVQTLALFGDSESISKKYKLGAKSSEDLTLLSENDMDPSVLALENAMKQLAIKRQKGNPMLESTSWALYHRSESQSSMKSIDSQISS